VLWEEFNGVGDPDAFCGWDVAFVVSVVLGGMVYEIAFTVPLSAQLARSIRRLWTITLQPAGARGVLLKSKIPFTWV